MQLSQVVIPVSKKPKHNKSHHALGTSDSYLSGTQGMEVTLRGSFFPRVNFFVYMLLRPACKHSEAGIVVPKYNTSSSESEAEDCLKFQRPCWASKLKTRQNCRVRFCLNQPNNRLMFWDSGCVLGRLCVQDIFILGSVMVGSSH